jgi:hypothetical protein
MVQKQDFLKVTLQRSFYIPENQYVIYKQYFIHSHPSAETDKWCATEIVSLCSLTTVLPAVQLKKQQNWS